MPGGKWRLEKTRERLLSRVRELPNGCWEWTRFINPEGCIVLAPGVFAHDGDEITDAQKVDLDRLHFQKIDMSDEIYVCNPGGYTGESTRREIEYARRQGKAVTSLVNLPWTVVR